MWLYDHMDTKPYNHVDTKPYNHVDNRRVVIHADIYKAIWTEAGKKGVRPHVLINDTLREIFYDKIYVNPLFEDKPKPEPLSLVKDDHGLLPGEMLFPPGYLVNRSEGSVYAKERGHAPSKLNPEQWAEIYKALDDKTESQGSLAKRFGVDASAISKSYKRRNKKLELGQSA